MLLLKKKKNCRVGIESFSHKMEKPKLGNDPLYNNQ